MKSGVLRKRAVSRSSTRPGKSSLNKEPETKQKWHPAEPQNGLSRPSCSRLARAPGVGTSRGGGAKSCPVRAPQSAAFRARQRRLRQGCNPARRHPGTMPGRPRARRALRSVKRLKMKAIAHFPVDLARVGVVRPAKGVAVVDQVAAVGHVEGVHGYRPILPERFAEGEPEGGVGRQVGGAVAVQKTRSVGYCRRRPSPPRQPARPHYTQRVALVMIKKKEAFFRRLEIGEPSGDGAEALHKLVRPRHVDSRAAKNLRRPQRGFPALDARSLNGERQKDVGAANLVVIKKVARVRAEDVDVEHPLAERDGDASLILLIAFGVQRKKCDAFLQRELLERPRKRVERRRLKISPVKASQDPAKPR